MLVRGCQERILCHLLGWGSVVKVGVFDMSGRQYYTTVDRKQ